MTMKKNLNNINLSILENHLRSDIMDSLGKTDAFAILYTINAFPKGYGETFQGAFTAKLTNFNAAVKLFEEIKKKPGIFEEIQFRAYGYYGNDYHEGKYDILECFRPNGKSWRIDFYDYKN